MSGRAQSPNQNVNSLIWTAGEHFRQDGGLSTGGGLCADILAGLIIFLCPYIAQTPQ